MAKCGIERIDNLIAGVEGTAPLTGADSGPEVAVLRDLLRCNGQRPPLLRAQPQPTFKVLTKALLRFQKAAGLQVNRKNPVAGHETFKRLTSFRAYADRVYGLASVTLLLDISPFTTAHRVLTLTTAWECDGLFAKSNLNTDGAGLSFGLIQWAQSQGRLTEIFTAFKKAAPKLLASTFGKDTDKMLAHVKLNQKQLFKLDEVKKAHPKLSAKEQQALVGTSKNPDFELTDATWQPRLKAAGRLTAFQKVQIQVALEAYEEALKKVQSHATHIASERGVAFMLDLVNQHGFQSKKKTGGLDFYDKAIAKLGQQAEEKALLEDITESSLARFKKRPGLKKGVAARRAFFLKTPLLSDGPYKP